MTNWKITDGKFKDLSFSVAIPKLNYNSSSGMMSQEVVNERRLQVSEKALIDGASVEDFGRKARTFSAEVIFFGSNYTSDLDYFENVLDEGSSGILILPDLSEAVWAKYQKHSRKTSAADGNATILNVSWIEDTSKNNSLIPAIVPNGLSVETFTSATNSVLDFAAKAQAAIDNNAVILAVKSAQSAVTTARVAINSVLNIARNTRETILSLTLSIKNDISAVNDTIDGIKNFKDILTLKNKATSPLQYSPNPNAVDFNSVGNTTASVATTTGDAKVIVEPNKTITLKSNDEAIDILNGLIKSIRENKNKLEVQTQGATIDYSKQSNLLINSIKDLIKALSNKPKNTILTSNRTTMLEICFDNGIDVSLIDDVYKNNRHIDDILNIPSFTIIRL